LRLPINRQMGSDLTFSHTNDGSTLPLGAYDTDIGNFAIVVKRILRQTRTFTLSGGLGINTPTSPDVRLRGGIHVDNYEVYDPNNPGQVLEVVDRVDVDFDGLVRNETINLQPFLAAQWVPNRRFFANGFLQVDVPLNKASTELVLDALITDDRLDGGFIADFIDESGEIAQQTLLRLNVGAGCWLYDNPCARFVQKAGFIFEVHYTTTLQDSDTVGTSVDLPNDLPDLADSLDITVGNLKNRVDIVNCVAGIPFQIG